MPTIICTVTNDLNYDQRMIRICSSLSKAGNQVTLVGRKKATSPTLVPQPFQQKRLPCYFQKGKFFYLEYNLRLFFWLLFQSFDIINSVDLDTILPGYFASLCRRKICVYDAHEYFTEVPELVERPFIQKIWKKIERFSLTRIKYAYTVCESLAEIFKKEYRIDFAVIRNVPFKEEYNNESHHNQEKTILLYQGALNEGRGLEQAIEAMTAIDNAELWLAGEGDLSSELRTMTKTLELSDKVKFLGYILPKDLKLITKQVDVGLNLLENRGLSYYYSLANKAFDYIQAGKPSINMNFPEYQKINSEFGTFLLIDNLENGELVAAIKQLIENKPLYQEIQNNCIKAAVVLNWEEEEKKLIQFYQNI